MVRVIKKIMGFFLPINTVIAAGEDLSKIQFKVQQEQLADSDLNIGNEARLMLIKSKDDIPPETESTVFR